MKIFHALGWAVKNVPCGFLGGPYFFAPQFCGPSIFGHGFGMMDDGEEFRVRLGESVGRLNLDTVLAG